MDEGSAEQAKRVAGESAAEAVEDGMVVGLGTGSTAAHAIRAIGRAVDAGTDVVGVPTSFQSRALAREAGIPLVDLDEVTGRGATAGDPGGAAGDEGDATIDLAIDGADQVAGGDLVKGGGGAHAREKVVDAAADRFLVVADPSKEAEVLDHPVPVEVLPAAWTVVAADVETLGGDPTLRAAEHKDGPVVTDNGNLVLDCDFGAIPEPGGLAADLSALPGLVEHGLFVDLADEVHCGREDGVDVRSV